MEINAKKLITISEINDSIVLDIHNTGSKCGGTFAYHFGDLNEVARFLTKVTKTLAVDGLIKFEIVH